MSKLYYEKRLNKRGDGCFDVIYADLGYRRIFLTIDRSAIAEILNVPVADLYSVATGYKVEVGKVDGSVFEVN